MPNQQPLRRHAPQSKPRHRIRKWIKRGVLGLGAVAGLIGLIYAWLPSPVAVDVTRVERTALDVEVDEDGQTRVRDRYAITAPTTGNLERIELQAGATVAAGDPIARISPPDPALLDARSRDEARARLAGARARLHRAETVIARAIASRDLAVDEAARAEHLLATGAITGLERDRLALDAQLAARAVTAAEAERAAATAEIAGVRALLEPRARGDRAPVVVTAPTAGKILRVIRDSAGPVAVGAPLVELGDPRSLEVVIDVLSSAATKIRPGARVSLEGWGGEPLAGTVRVVEPSAFTKISSLGVEEQRVNVIVDVAEAPASLGDGFRVDARIFLWRGTDIPTVPASAVFRDHERWAVYRIEDERARLRAITIGHRGRARVEVIAGVAEGDALVLHPSDKVTDGTRVRAR